MSFVNLSFLLKAFFGYDISVASGMVMKAGQVNRGFGQIVPQRGLRRAP